MAVPAKGRQSLLTILLTLYDLEIESDMSTLKPYDISSGIATVTTNWP
jgi:hypothetical protein